MSTLDDFLNENLEQKKVLIQNAHSKSEAYRKIAEAGFLPTHNGKSISNRTFGDFFKEKAFQEVFDVDKQGKPANPPHKKEQSGVVKDNNFLFTEKSKESEVIEEMSKVNNIVEDKKEQGGAVVDEKKQSDKEVLHINLSYKINYEKKGKSVNIKNAKNKRVENDISKDLQTIATNINVNEYCLINSILKHFVEKVKNNNISIEISERFTKDLL